MNEKFPGCRNVTHPLVSEGTYPTHAHQGINEPALLAYAWMGDRGDLLNQKMVFTRKRK